MVRFSIDSGYLLAYVEELRNRWKSSLREKKIMHHMIPSPYLPERQRQKKGEKKYNHSTAQSPLGYLFPCNAAPR